MHVSDVVLHVAPVADVVHACATACFLGALQLAAARHNKKELAEQAKVTANVFLGHPTNTELDGFGLRAEINVEGCPDDSIIADAHEVSKRPLFTASRLALTSCLVSSARTVAH